MNMQSIFIFYSLSVLLLIYSVSNLQSPQGKKETSLIIPKVIIVQYEHTEKTPGQFTCLYISLQKAVL